MSKTDRGDECDVAEQREVQSDRRALQHLTAEGGLSGRSPTGCDEQARAEYPAGVDRRGLVQLGRPPARYLTIRASPATRPPANPPPGALWPANSR